MIPKIYQDEAVIEGVRIRAGSIVGLMVAAANRDPAYFPNPDRFDLYRPHVPHLAFGVGPHMCAGTWATRWSIGQVAVPHLYERHPDLAIDQTRPVRWAGWFFRGLTECPVTWTEAR